MDSDSEVNAALDILAEFCTQKNSANGTHFNINFKKPENLITKIPRIMMLCLINVK